MRSAIIFLVSAILTMSFVLGVAYGAGWWKPWLAAPVMLATEGIFALAVLVMGAFAVLKLSKQPKTGS